MLTYYLLIGMPILCVASVLTYWYDKRQAIHSKRRVPEATLLTLDFCGGWPGAIWAQQKFRHKTKKISFRVKFYLAIGANIVLIYLIASGKVGWEAFQQLVSGGTGS